MSKPGLIRGRVSFGAHEEYRVLLEGGGETAAEPSGTLRACGELPGVGDWVWVRPAGEFSLIEVVEARKTAFIRKAAGRNTRRSAWRPTSMSAWWFAGWMGISTCGASSAIWCWPGRAGHSR